METKKTTKKKTEKIDTMRMNQELRDKIAENNDMLLFADGFDGAIVGITEDCMHVVYDANKMIEILVKYEEMTYEDAVDYLGYNTFCAYVGENTPIYINLIKDL